jgi:hypothetical protein
MPAADQNWSENMEGAFGIRSQAMGETTSIMDLALQAYIRAWTQGGRTVESLPKDVLQDFTAFLNRFLATETKGIHLGELGAVVVMLDGREFSLTSYGAQDAIPEQEVGGPAFSLNPGFPTRGSNVHRGGSIDLTGQVPPGQ